MWPLKPFYSHFMRLGSKTKTFINFTHICIILQTFNSHHSLEVKLSRNRLELVLDLLERICIDFHELPNIFMYYS
jgi:hypothetical protein